MGIQDVSSYKKQGLIMNAREYYEAGQLNKAIDATIAEVKKHPTDIARRGFLCELLFAKREWERIDKQLDLIGHQDPNTMHMVALWRQLLRAGQARDQFFSDGRIPEVLEAPDELLQSYLKASVAMREGNKAEAYTLLEQAECKRPILKGMLNGKAFEDFRDLDDTAPAVFEVFTSTGKYYWIPFSRINQLTFHAAEGPIDLIFRRASLETNQNGPDGEVYVPAVYQTLAGQDQERLMLGRASDWLGEEGEPIRGVGQKMFLVDEQSISIMEIEELSFE
ncbi:MAG TPA: SciE type virulence protein [Gammaproteobacteria bacterium]|nr:SciE type virulence protein [Gammaproteobacteria bacterium]